MDHRVVVRRSGLVPYEQAFEAMRQFSATRDCDTTDEFWVLQHEPVFTLGYSCTAQTRAVTEIPVVPTDRGGQMTYHGPGQLVIYLLIDMTRRRQGVRHLVSSIESAIRDVLQSCGIHSELKESAPGVYVGGEKIASIGIRIRRGCSYHGLSLNVDVDTEPFELIDVCGFPGLKVTNLRRIGCNESMASIQERCIASLCRHLNYETAPDT
ncbi:MAG: lipoyl(octanoyl) transferase LipB [Acidiferrobacterales bacterium]|nr:lipoyl(octanoyl) transferase LipB [Acidiferrobacterales bacterium]